MTGTMYPPIIPSSIELAHSLARALDAVAVSATDPVSVATGAFAASGTLGATVLILGLVVWYLWREGKIERADAKAREDKLVQQIAELNALRIADSRDMQERLLSVVTNATSVIGSTTAATSEMRTALVDVRDALAENSAELKTLSERSAPRR